MAVLDLKRKLAILSDAAKYDASCASSGGTKRDSLGGKGALTDNADLRERMTPKPPPAQMDLF